MRFFNKKLIIFDKLLQNSIKNKKNLGRKKVSRNGNLFHKKCRKIHAGTCDILNKKNGRSVLL